jgi:membrane protein required for colicin V production
VNDTGVPMPGVVGGLTWLDIAALVVLGLSLVLGLFRGLVREVFALVGWIAAAFVATWFAEPATAWVPGIVGDPRMRWVVAFIVIFFLVLVGAGFISLLASRLIRAAGIGLGDRVLGGVFGVGRGLVILVIAALVAGMTPLPRDPMWTKSMVTAPLASAALTLKPYLPSPIADRVKF